MSEYDPESPVDPSKQPETEGEYNPSGGIPSHPADPGFGDKDKDDAYDAGDEETPAETTEATDDTEPA